MSAYILKPEKFTGELANYQVTAHHFRLEGAGRFDDGTVYAVLIETSGFDSGTHETVFATAEGLQKAILHVQSLKAPGMFGGTTPNPLAASTLESSKPRMIESLQRAQEAALAHAADPSANCIAQRSRNVYEIQFMEARHATQAEIQARLASMRNSAARPTLG